jgi:hypothetical protein
MNPLDSIEVRLKEIARRRAELDQESGALEEAKKILLQTYKRPASAAPSVESLIEPGDVGMTDAVRGAYRLNPDRKLAAAQIYKVIEGHGFNVSRYENAMANIHQIIGRLKESAELDGPFVQGNEKAYQWSGRSRKK